jgi:acyl transferase domain-containing protein/short-subunit dehydrogenase/acyl carrier protein
MNELSPIKRALHALQVTRARLDALEQARREPIAVVGIGCRFPGGADDPRAFWRLLRDGVDAVTEVPPDRWDVEAYYDPDVSAPGKTITRYGAFVPGVRDFDPEFFGISPREAVTIDPQQRLLLEVAWEALEHAGIAPDALSGSATGVFVGICGRDYSYLLNTRGRTAIDAYMATGIAHSVASGRLSYLLGLAGPSFAVDTACSSSLVALHTACQSLRNRECDAALAAGVNRILVPDLSINFSKNHMLSPTGRCRAFDAAADGFTRGEGCGVLVLERLSDAAAAGHTVLALIRGSALNQDGRTSGLTVPNGPAQQAVITKALESAELDPSAVSYVEAHGTGTALGDPIEIGALAAVYGRGRDRDRPLVVGSVKTNIGHLEGAAGIAGVIKTVLALSHREIPPSLHFDRPSPHIDWDGMPITVPTAPRAWTTDGTPRRAGVSSFGFSGTNGHVVLQEAPVPAPIVADRARPRHVLALSARHEDSLKQLAAAYALMLEGEDADLADVCFTANTGRAVFAHRLALVARSAGEAARILRDFAEGRDVAAATGRCDRGFEPRLALVFPAVDAVSAGAGRELYETEARFRDAIDACDAALRADLGRSLIEILYGGETERLARPSHAYPAVFALGWALGRLWDACGVRPHATTGRGVGELVAACATGALPLADGLRRAVAWGRAVEGGTAPDAWEGRDQVERARGPAEDASGSGVVIEIGPAMADWSAVTGALARAFASGVPVDWKAFDAGRGRRLVPGLPTYPFRRRPIWPDLPGAPGGEAAPAPAAPGHPDGPEHPLLDHAIRSPLVAASLYESWFSLERVPLIHEHTLFGAAVIPGACQLSMIVGAAAHAYGGAPVHLADVVFHRALSIPEGPGRRVQIGLFPGDRAADVKLLSVDAADAGGDGVVHTTGKLLTGSPCEPDGSRWGRAPIAALWQTCGDETGRDRLYSRERLGDIGLGPSYAWVDAMRSAGRDVIAMIRVPDTIAHVERFALHPGLIDSCVALMVMTVRPSPGKVFIPFGVEEFRWFRAVPGGRLWAHARYRETPETSVKVVGDIRLTDDRGEVIAEIIGLEGREADREVLLRGIQKDLGHWFHAVDWVPAARDGGAGAAAGRWLVVGDAAGVGHDLAVRLERRGARVARHRVDAAIPAALDGVVCLSGLDVATDDPDEAIARGCAPVLALVQALAARTDRPRLVLVTRGAQSLGGARANAGQAALWGLGRTIAAERPDLGCVTFDLDPDGAPDQLDALCDELLGESEERRVALRAGRRHVARLVRRRVTVDRRVPEIRGDGSYLVTGGLGGLGLAVAEWLASLGARHLVLAGRRAPSPEALDAIARMERAGATVRVRRADVARAADVAALIDAANSGAPLRGIVHAAGVLDDAVLARQDAARFAAAMAPKALGLRHLHERTRDLPLDFVVAFSSLVSVLELPGQASYAAASAYMDALAHDRRAAGWPITVVNWGPWAGAGMLAALGERDRRRMAETGLIALERQHALRALGAALHDGPATIAIADLEWAALARSAPHALHDPFLAAFTRGLGGAPTATWKARLAETAPEGRRALLTSLICGEIAAVLKLPSADEIGARDPVFDLGVDSLMAIELQRQIETSLGHELRSTVIFDFPTVEALVDHLVAELGLDKAADAEAPRGTAAVASPGRAGDLERLSGDELVDLLEEKLAALERGAGPDTRPGRSPEGGLPRP